jgi:DNA-binding transcriptional ArsR family regulator
MSPDKLEPLDPVIHAPVRLAVLSVLVSAKSAEFNSLKELTETTDGNLSTHLAKLEEAGYMAVKKSFRGKKPLTTCSITERGRSALAQYLKTLEGYLPKGK